MEEQLLTEILRELRASNEALYEMKRELKQIKEDTNVIADNGLSLSQRTAIASETLVDKFTARYYRSGSNITATSIFV